MAQGAMAAVPLRYASRPWFSSLFSGKSYQLYSSNSAFPARGGFRTHGLRPPGTLLAEDGPREEDSGSAAVPSKKSRNELKREARRAVKWAMELASFSTPQIKRVLRVASLEREVFDALMLVKSLGPDVREGKRRQFNYIGRLLRAAQPELMEALIQASKDGDHGRLQTLSSLGTLSIEDDEEEEEDTIRDEEETIHEEEEEEGRENYRDVAARWFDGLVYKDKSITNEVYSVQNVEFDRQELRRLVRQVQSIQEGPLVEVSGVENDAKLTRAKKPLLRFLRSLAKQSSAE